jgi:hypothetical protein
MCVLVLNVSRYALSEHDPSDDGVCVVSTSA